MDKEFITIKKASEMLCVSKLTLRNWDRDGKLVALRNPISNYRVYLKGDIENMINQIKSGEKPLKKSRKTKLKSRILPVISLKD